MLSDEIIELEICLLLIKYGERKVINSLAKVVDLDIKDIETKLQRIQRPIKKPVKKNAKLRLQFIDKIIDQYPERANLLKILYSRFQNKTFLPELRDIKRLLDRYSLESRGVKSRNAAAPKVFNLLATLDETELMELSQQQERGGYSSLGIISDEILGPKN
jgi:hypothetical protein